MQKQFKNLLKGILIYGFGNASAKLVGLVLLRLYTNPKYLSVEEYKVFLMLEITNLVIVSLFSLALSNAYIRWYWDKDQVNKRKSILFSCLAVLSGIGIIIAVSGFYSSKLISTLLFDKEIFAIPISLMILGSSLQLITDLTLSQMRVEEKPTFYISSNIIRLIVSLTLTIYLLKYLHQGVVGIQEAIVFGNVAFIIITIPYLLKNIEFKFNLQVIKEMIHFSLPLALGSISGVLLAQFDRYVLNFKSTSLNVGVYSIAFKIANITKIFLVNSIQIALTPTYFKLMNHPDHKAIYSRIMTWFTIIVVYASLFISLFGLEITKFFSTGTIYWDAYKIIPILSLGIVFATLKDCSVIGLQVVKRTKIIGVTLMVSAALSLGLNILLIPYFGTYGAAASSLIIQVIYFATVQFYAQKYYYIPYRLDRVFIIIIVGSILFFGGSLFNNEGIGIRLIIKFFALLLFPIFLLAFRVFDKSEINAFKSFIVSIKNIFINTTPKDVDEQISEVEESQ